MGDRVTRYLLVLNAIASAIARVDARDASTFVERWHEVLGR